MTITIKVNGTFTQNPIYFGTASSSITLSLNLFINCAATISAVPNGVPPFLVSGLSLTAPYSVFLASSYTTNSNPSYCSLTYTFYDSSGNLLPGSSTLMSYNSLTGEFKIQSFSTNPTYGSGYF